MRDKILKIIFIISFIPYLLLIYTILTGRYMINGTEIHGIERILKNISSSVWYFAYAVPAIPICLMIEISYIFRKKENIIFKCSFIPYIFILAISVFYAFSGVRFLGDTLYYGLEGFEIGIFEGLLFYNRVPIIPVCLIIEIYHIIKKLKTNNKKFYFNFRKMGINK